MRKTLSIGSLAAVLALSLSQSAQSITAPSFIVFFDWNSEVLSAQGRDTIHGAVWVNRELQVPRQFVVTGHTDGTEPDAQRLSLRRAIVVKNALQEEAVAEKDIQVVGKGATQPLSRVPPDKPEPQNRRVEILRRY